MHKIHLTPGLHRKSRDVYRETGPRDLLVCPWSAGIQNVKNVPGIAPAIGQLLPAIDQPRQPRQTCMLVQATDRVRWQAQLCHLLNFLEKAVRMYQLRKVSTRGSRVIESISR